MLGRSKLMEVGGGDKVQVVNTAEELKKLGVEVDIQTSRNFDPTSFDIVHVFQLDWVPETYFYVKKAKKYGKPVVLSPIHHNVGEVKKFDDEFAFDYRRVSRVLFKDQFKRDTFKNIYRSITNREILWPTLFSVFYGFKRMQKETLEMADYVLVQTNKEHEDLELTYNVSLPKWEKVVNGVSANFINLENTPNQFDFSDYILCVGRIEPRKNQLSVIKAVEMLRNEEKLDLKLVLVGKIGKTNKHFEYNKLVQHEIDTKNWITHLPQVPYENMSSIYKYAKVGVSASWFETTGLTSLEALYCGTNAVASGDRAKEYLGKYASYCLPDDITSIKEAIKKEYYASRPSITETLKKEYTWEIAAKKTLEVYNSILGI